MTPPTARLLIVDDHLLLSQGLAALLVARGIDPPRIVDPTREDPLAAAHAEDHQVVLLDIDFGNERRAGMDLIAELTAWGHRVIMFTGSNDEAIYGACIDRGAETVIPKSATLDAVVDELERVLRGDRIGDDSDRFRWYQAFRARQTEREGELAPFATLTQREAEVLAALVDGLTVDEIADASYVAVSTVRSQVQSVFTKLGVHSQLAAVARARRVRWQAPTTV